MQRVKTHHAIVISYVTFLTDSVFISIEKLLKQSSAERNNFSLHLPCYKDDLLVCLYFSLKQYIDRTKILRGTTRQLFISFQKPYKLVSRSTLSRWYEFK